VDEPREFRIVENLHAALQAIKTADGYHYTVQGTAVKLDPNHESEKLIPGTDPPFGPPRPFVLLDLSRPDEFDFPERSGRVRVTRPFDIGWVHDSDTTDDASLLRTYFRGLADVETAIVKDISRGELAYETRILNRQMREPLGRQVWAIVSGEIVTTRNYGAPNE
jgi:hypothetical protein